MPRANVNDLLAFLAVARERSFTRAAAQMGVSQSALSHTIRGLEERLGLRLLTRTTRSVAPTEAGERLLRNVGHHFDEIEAAIDSLSELKERPSGTIRINSSEYAAETLLWPKLAEFLPHYPDVKVEIWADYMLADIVAERFDAGVRLGEQVADSWSSARLPISPGANARATRRTCSSIAASICGCLRSAGSMRGSSKRTATRSRSGSRGSSSSMPCHRS